MSAAAPLIQEKYSKYPPFAEEQPPMFPDRPQRCMSVKQQWLNVVVIWILLVAWAVEFCLETLTGQLAFFVRNVVPLLVFFGLCIPLACSLIGYVPPKGAVAALVWILLCPVVFAPWKALLPTLYGYFCSIIMAWMFTAIHCGSATTLDGTTQEARDKDFMMTYVQVALITMNMPLIYLWQFSIHVPLNYKVRWVVTGFAYGKDVLKMSIQQITGRAPAYNEKEFRTYKLNDVQYIRMFTCRVSILVAMMAVARILEETYCESSEYVIDGALFTWGDCKLYPFKYTKELPVCEW